MDCATLGDAPGHPAAPLSCPPLQRAYAAESHTRQAAQVAHLALAWDVFTRFAVDAAAMDAATRDTLLEEVWTMLTTAASQQGALLQHESPEHRFLALLSDGFASKRAYLENLNGDCPLDGEAGAGGARHPPG